jgi:hypothetical protein
LSIQTFTIVFFSLGGFSNPPSYFLSVTVLGRDRSKRYQEPNVQPSDTCPYTEQSLVWSFDSCLSESATYIAFHGTRIAIEKARATVTVRRDHMRYQYGEIRSKAGLAEGLAVCALMLTGTRAEERYAGSAKVHISVMVNVHLTAATPTAQIFLS